ncbi:MAG: DUF4339 domain-containing protein [Treponema sp.]|nr:DUF4339 domain-containing protein [Treponema sp.]
MGRNLCAVIIGIVMITGTGGIAAAQAIPVLTGFFVAVGGQPTGPHGTAGLMELVNRGQLTSATFVWREGMPAWAAAGTVAELLPFLPAAPPPLPAGQVPPGMPPPPVPTAVARYQRWFNSFAPGIEDNRVFINAGVGLGPTGAYSMGIPPISASVSFRVSDTVPITVGASGILSTWRWQVPFWYDITFWNIGIGARVMYHFNFARNFDSYIGLNLGYVIQNATGTAAFAVPAANSFFLWGFIAGARFFFTDSFGIYAEAGASSLQFLSLGVTFKF